MSVEPGRPRGPLVPEMGDGAPGASFGSMRHPAGSAGGPTRRHWGPRRPVRSPTSSAAAFARTGASSSSPAPLCVHPGPTTGRVLSAVRWPQQLHTRLLEVSPDGKVSRDGLDGPYDGLVFDPAHPERGTAQLDGLVLAVSPDSSRVLVGRQTATGTDLRVVDGRNLKDLTRTVEVAETYSPALGARTEPRRRSGSDGGVVLDPKTMTLQRAMDGHSGPVMELVFTGASGDLVWTAGQDGTSVAFDCRAPGLPSPRSHPTLSPSRAPPASPPTAASMWSSPTRGQTPRSCATLPPVTASASLSTTSEHMIGPTAPSSSPRRSPSLQTAAPSSSGTWGSSPAVGGVVDHGAVVIFDALTRQQRAVLELPWPVYGIAVTPDSSRAVINGAGGYAVVDLAQARWLTNLCRWRRSPGKSGPTARRHHQTGDGPPSPATVRSSSSTSPPTRSTDAP